MGNQRSEWKSYVNIFLVLFVGYCSYTIARRAVVIVTRDLQNTYSLNNSNIGAINSTFSIAYGISKFFAGIATDYFSSNTLFAGGLFFAGLTNLFFPMFSSLYGFCFLWFINGLAQGCGWPSLSKIMLNAFPKNIRGSVWGLLTMGGNVGQSMSPLLLSYVYFKYGWQYAFFMPGIWAATFAIVAYIILITSNSNNSNNNAVMEPKESKKSPKKKIENTTITTTTTTFTQGVLLNINFWILIIADILIYFILKAFSDWSIKLLKEDRGFGSMVSSTCLSAYESGGVVGTLFTGIISDYLHSRRNLTSFFYVLILFPSILALYLLGKDASSITISIVLFSLGFSVYGPKTMCGLAVREMCDEKFAGTAGGLLGLAGQLGAAIAGYPLGLLADNYGWNSFYILLLSSSIIVILLFGILQYNYVPNNSEETKIEIQKKKKEL
jgi:OPA family sugar phosphate sensor protein UhpC-like MFS transporter